MGDDILNLYGTLKAMQMAYVDFGAVKNVTQSVERWAMLRKSCHLHSLGEAGALPMATAGRGTIVTR